jgi:hypothetical protein
MREVVATVMVDNVAYYRANGNFAFYMWVRNEGDSTLVLDEENMDNNPDTNILVSEDFTIGYSPPWNFTLYHGYAGLQFPWRAVLLEQGFLLLFGQVCEYKYFGYEPSINSDLYHEAAWVRGFGWIYFCDEWGEVVLNSCIINGVTYGSPPVSIDDETDMLTKPVATAYPNPFKDNISINISNYHIKSGYILVEVYNIKGQCIKQAKIITRKEESENMINLHFDNICSGVYLISITDGGKTIDTLKLININ